MIAYFTLKIYSTLFNTHEDSLSNYIKLSSESIIFIIIDSHVFDLLDNNLNLNWLLNFYKNSFHFLVQEMMELAKAMGMGWYFFIYLLFIKNVYLINKCF